jgi:hypothetical protein
MKIPRIQSIAVAVALLALLVPVPAQALENEDLLALVAMPLAVAAVSEITDVPMNDLMSVVSLLNDAAVPAPQFIEVIRYAPVALVVEPPDGPTFVEYIRLQEADGLRGTALVTSIEERLRIYDIPVLSFDVDRARVFDVTDTFVPAVVTERIASSRRAHPHGGPPGQLKKAAGVQTGAEFVHGTSRHVATKSSPKARKPAKVRNDDDRTPRVSVDRKAGKDDGKGKGKSGNGGGNGKGGGKGKG